jgi:predicted nucleic acid-binding protein
MQRSIEYENSLNPYENRREGVDLLSHLCGDIVGPSPAVAKMAGKILKGSQVKPRDALHLACAEAARCDYFLTCDDTLIRIFQRKRSVLELKIMAVNPVEFIRGEGEQYGKS